MCVAIATPAPGAPFEQCVGWVHPTREVVGSTIFGDAVGRLVMRQPREILAERIEGEATCMNDRTDPAYAVKLVNCIPTVTGPAPLGDDQPMMLIQSQCWDRHTQYVCRFAD